MGQSARNTKDSESVDLNRFSQLSTRLADLAASRNIHITPYRDPKFPHFHAATSEQREQALATLALTVRLCEETRNQGEDFGRSAPLIWSFFRGGGFTPPSDFHDKIVDGDMVDVYNEHGQLIFANLQFYAVNSYSLEDLYFRPWHELYFHQPAEIQNQLKEICAEILTGPHGVRDVRHLGPHSVIGIHEPIQLVARPTFFSSLVKGSRVAGFVCINQILER